MQLLWLIPILSAIAVYVVRLFELNTKREVVSGKIRENLTLKLFMVTGTVMLLGSILEFYLRDLRISWVAYAAGVLCAIVSFKLRWAAIAALGRFWSLHVEIRDTHEFVKTGPFRWMRHPTYFSMILELLALGLILNAWVMLLIIPFFFIPVLIARVRLEEAALVEKFGDAYREYKRTTPAVIPWRTP